MIMSIRIMRACTYKNRKPFSARVLPKLSVTLKNVVHKKWVVLGVIGVETILEQN